MPDDIWNEGFECDHNILAGGYNPTGAIYGWMNEGYSLSTQTWDTLGHRSAIVSPATETIQFGYCGYIAVGDVTGGYTLYSYEGDTPVISQGGYWNFKDAFSAFPCPGPMPNWMINARYSAWNLVLDLQVFENLIKENVVVKVTNLSTNESYQCTVENNKPQVYEYSISFVQPTPANGSQYTDSYQVDITGLVDRATGKSARITYQVDFFGREEMTGWYKYDNHWVVFDEYGQLITGWYKDGSWYYLENSGVMVQNCWKKIGNYWYHFSASGAMQTGWLKDGNNWYYLYSDGSMAKDTMIGSYKIGSNGVWIP